MIKTFLPSKNRACQLRLLLDSIEQNFPNVCNLHICYLATTQEYLLGYEKLKKQFPRVHFTPQSHYGENFYSFLEDAGDDIVGILTDDCIFYRKFLSNSTKIRNYFKDSSVFSLGTRCGVNTTLQYYVENLPSVGLAAYGGYIEDGDWIRYNFHAGPANYDYGFFLCQDGSFYRANELLKLSNKISRDQVDHPRRWEELLCNNNNRSYLPPYMIQPKYSVLTVSSNNCVSQNYLTAGVKYPFSAKELNDKYLSGYKIDFLNIDFSEVNSAHLEFDFTFTEDDRSV